VSCRYFEMAATSWDSLDSWFDILTLAGMSLQLERDHAVPNDPHLLMYRQYHTFRLVRKAFRDLFKKHPSPVGLCVGPGRLAWQQSAPAFEHTAPQPSLDADTDVVRPSTDSRCCTGCFALPHTSAAEAGSELGRRNHSSSGVSIHFPHCL